jgi:hypothetical protein
MSSLKIYILNNNQKTLLQKNLFYETYWIDIIDEFNNHEKTTYLSTIKIKFQKDWNMRKKRMQIQDLSWKYEEKLFQQKKHDIATLVDDHEFLIQKTFASHMLIVFFFCKLKKRFDFWIKSKQLKSSF